MACTVSMNNGAVFTGQRTVTIRTNIPEANQVLLANDGGFVDEAWQPYQSELSWALSDVGQQVVTLSVHARFRNAAAPDNLLCGGTLLDDIIYDPVPPSVQIVSFIPSVTAADGSATNVYGILTLMATDQPDGSGVAEMQISHTLDFTTASWQPFVNSGPLAALAGDEIYVRVRDSVGNISEPASLSLRLPFEIYLPVVVK